jgi:hypothetical protein
MLPTPTRGVTEDALRLEILPAAATFLRPTNQFLIDNVAAAHS